MRPVDLDGISQILSSLSRFKMPESPAHSLVFLMSEVGEFADAVTRTFQGYTRNTQEQSDMGKLAEEAADIIIMTVVTLYVTYPQITINDALFAKLTKLITRCGDGEQE